MPPRRGCSGLSRRWFLNWCVRVHTRLCARGCPGDLRSDNGPELRAGILRAWLAWLEVRTLFIEPGSPGETGCGESSNGKLRDELLGREIFYTLREAQILVEGWRQHYNHYRPHSALQDRTPAEVAAAWMAAPGGRRSPRPLPRTHGCWLRHSIELH
jgi:transposase InsO family protein